MSSASLAIVPHAQPDRVHITALSLAITVNLAVLMVALRPLPASPATPFRPVQALTIHFFDPPPPLPPAPPTLEVKPLPHTVPTVTHAPVTPPTPPIAAPTEQGTIPAPPIATPTIAPAPLPAAPSAPVEASLAYRAAPLKFPAPALRQHLQGTVVLRVLVDEQGKPLSVEIEHSSGHALLDRSARAQVLASWRFQPAVVNGQHVRAWARVPVSFELQQL